MDQRTEELRRMRTVHGALLIAVLLYIYVAEQHHRAGEVPAEFAFAFAILAFVVVAIAIFFRRTKLPLAVELLRRNPAGADAWKKWRFPIILSMVLAESVALDGFVLR